MELKKSPRSIIDDFLFLILPLTLFIGGIVILTLKIPFWSLFLGIASTQIGIVFIIFSYEYYTKRKNKPITEDYKAIPCLLCKRINYVPKYKNTTICDSCNISIANAAKSLVVVAFALFTMGSILYFMKYEQDIRRQAKTGEIFTCEEGVWKPQLCSCGKGVEYNCPEGTISRKCSDNNYYCCHLDYQEGQEIWVCTQVE
jgi:Ca2+/Na+ antiporter